MFKCVYLQPRQALKDDIISTLLCVIRWLSVVLTYLND